MNTTIMNKSEIQRTINNIIKLKDAIITQHLIKFDEDKVPEQVSLIQEELRSLDVYLIRIKKEVFYK